MLDNRETWLRQYLPRWRQLYPAMVDQMVTVWTDGLPTAVSFSSSDHYSSVSLCRLKFLTIPQLRGFIWALTFCDGAMTQFLENEKKSRRGPSFKLKKKSPTTGREKPSKRHGVLSSSSTNSYPVSLDSNGERPLQHEENQLISARVIVTKQHTLPIEEMWNRFAEQVGTLLCFVCLVFALSFFFKLLFSWVFGWS